ncbi:hypothetical protein A2926_00320 [Candidatus Giovannonibacteria bacterium RIFCSPLOWO2_01_FULL_44_40]|uniref:HicB-like antitoxin of toxin-antitoxin system domain-containing protein n=1 Tax=Candidatus Giovannonibacteria bacterium RIFCSPHIGHO2_01_FULL_45_23 TaxID=1798325 RepID=A0A1F5VEP1_9BACT|nr:MAG: hypothetical protein A2834_00335 [Candidatus Giovannonibacteria bacterium RIFCSPHIGHO2_01_FULL_45_23]OGF76497.1 MAG: hypothetical protein A3C77_03045 [Candidatus Giovannonibacteria bacterium RIFCSPHIGHO2_02_FULL_45_13]OGF79762.1 MAG: hypothetical protein A2926_00320 [Candidatus Giovannonibacteria bacterium RIFCSPLOWO2_01_FULL_44_40]
MTYKSTIVINKESEWFVAYSLELGVASQGKTIEEAQANLKEAIELYLEDQPVLRKKLACSNVAPLVTSLELKHV